MCGHKSCPRPLCVRGGPGIPCMTPRAAAPQPAPGLRARGGWQLLLAHRLSAKAGHTQKCFSCLLNITIFFIFIFFYERCLNWFAFQCLDLTDSWIWTWNRLDCALLKITEMWVETDTNNEKQPFFKFYSKSLHLYNLKHMQNFLKIRLSNPKRINIL